jgi:hypothetical protein
MNALAAPVGAREERHADLGDIRRPGAIPVVIERPAHHVVPDVDAVGVELLLRQRRPGDGHAGDRVAAAAFADAVLNGAGLDLRPALGEFRQDAALPHHVAVVVVVPLPRDDRRQVLRIALGDAPLRHRVVRDAEHPDLAAAPRLRAGPFDALLGVVGLPRLHRVQHAGRPAGAARVDAHDRVVVRHPALRIGDLPVLILVGGAFEDLRVVRDHLVPLRRITFLIREALAIRAVGEDHRETAFARRAEHVGAQHDPVAHRDRDVPVDAHAVADFRRAEGIGCRRRGGRAFVHGSPRAFPIERRGLPQVKLCAMRVPRTGDVTASARDRSAPCARAGACQPHTRWAGVCAADA